MVLLRTGQGKIIGWFPRYSVLRVMKHMLACRAEGTQIVPRWSSSPFWPMIFRQNLVFFRQNLVYQDYITDVIEFSNPEGFLYKALIRTHCSVLIDLRRQCWL